MFYLIIEIRFRAIQKPQNRIFGSFSLFARKNADDILLAEREVALYELVVGWLAELEPTRMSGSTLNLVEIY